MLQFQNRFHGHSSLKYVYKHGVSQRSRMITVRSIHNPRRQHARFAVVVSKKILKSAVGRNRIRRRVYEVIRQELPKLKPSHDVVVLIFSSEVRDIPFTDLQENMRSLLERAGLYREQ